MSESPTSEMSYRVHMAFMDRFGKKLQKTKYVGVTIDSKLSGNSHIDAVTNRANQTTAFINRISSCPKDRKAKCYKSIVVCISSML